VKCNGTQARAHGKWKSTGWKSTADHAHTSMRQDVLSRATYATPLCCLPGASYVLVPATMGVRVRREAVELEAGGRLVVI